MSVFEYSDYRKFIKDQLLAMPKKGFGQMSRLSEKLGVHTTLVSQVMSGDKQFSEEQGILIAEFFALNELESEFFVTLIELSRAGNQSLRKLRQKKLDSI